MPTIIILMRLSRRLIVLGILLLAAVGATSAVVLTDGDERPLEQRTYAACKRRVIALLRDEGNHGPIRITREFRDSGPYAFFGAAFPSDAPPTTWNCAVKQLHDGNVRATAHINVEIS